MIRVIFLGYGNVNFHLCSALIKQADIAVIQIYNKTLIDTAFLINSIPFTSDLSEIKAADIYILGIPDDAIASFSEIIPFKNKLVVHTSGAVEMAVLSAKNRRGVFYPLQSFSKYREIEYEQIPICIESENATDLDILKKIGNSISNNVVEINSKERAKLHLAAVFVNNFVNHLYQIGHEILADTTISFDLLKPLIQETANKIGGLTPFEAQTGPAKRADSKTIEKHLHLLEESEYREIYLLLTNAIKKSHGKKL